MIARATLVRIAFLSTALGALTGCDTVGGAMSSAGSSVGGFLAHRDRAGGASWDLQRPGEDHGDAAHRQHVGLFPDLSGRGDDGRGEGWPVSYCDRPGQSPDADSSTCRPLFDHRWF